MTLSVEEAVASLSAPHPSYDMMLAHHRFYTGRYRTWHDAVTGAGQKPDAKTAAKLVKLLGEVGAPQLRHYLAEHHEHLDAGEQGLQLALRAAACSPSWDPVFVAWSLRGIAFWLRKLGREAEAKALLAALLAREPFYALGREEALAMGVSSTVAEPRGLADSLRLAGFHVLLGEFRSTHLKHIAMATSLIWSGDFAAAARMAALAGKGAAAEGTWATDIETFALRKAEEAPGELQPLPDAEWGARYASVAPAIERKDLASLHALARDSNAATMLAAWVGLAQLGEVEPVRGLLLEMYRALDVRPSPDLRHQVGFALKSCDNRPTKTKPR